MNREELIAQIVQKRSFLCVGLDTNPKRIPEHLNQEPDPVFAFNKAIIDATAPYAVSYKLNSAFYEAQGPKGWASMEKTLNYLPKDCFSIADAKRGDIGNTSRLYASAFFEQMSFDSITVAPYMGVDSVTPFLDYSGKWVILLGLTSNPGSADFQQLDIEGAGEKVFERVLKTASGWGTPSDLMFVVGATRGSLIGEVRKIVPDHFLLVPGVGKQGGSLDDVVNYGMTQDCGLLVNSSRGIIYAGEGTDFAEKAAEEARKLQVQMEGHLQAKGVI